MRRKICSKNQKKIFKTETFQPRSTTSVKDRDAKLITDKQEIIKDDTRILWRIKYSNKHIKHRQMCQ